MGHHRGDVLQWKYLCSQGMCAPVCVCMRVCVCVCVCMWCLLCIQNTGEQTVAVDGGAGAEEEAEQGCEMENPEGKYWP